MMATTEVVTVTAAGRRRSIAISESKSESSVNNYVET